MKTIGLIGGMSWESTAAYYRLINQIVAQRLGGLHSARIVLYSVDFEPVERAGREDRWDDAAAVLCRAARGLRAAGAQFVVLATNTMHKLADAIEQAAGMPLIHIADVTGQAVARAGLDTVGLLGTAFTMEQDFYRGRLGRRFGLNVLVPPGPQRAQVHRIIYEELCRGRIEDASRSACLSIIDDLAARGCQGVILGCTELPLLIRPEHASVPLFDTTLLHAQAAVERALSD